MGELRAKADITALLVKKEDGNTKVENNDDTIWLANADSAKLEPSAKADADADARQPLGYSWRIFPPPSGTPRRTKKNKNKKQKNKQQQTPQPAGSKQESIFVPISKKVNGGIDPQEQPKETKKQRQDLSQNGKELWRQKQQQYQYAYPYKVGEIIRMLVPQKKEQRDNNDVRADYEYPKQKIQKLTKDEIRIVEFDSKGNEMNSKTNKNINININSNKNNNNNQLVPGFARVDEIVQKENEGQETWVHVTRLSDHKAMALSPKEQRKLLCPELALNESQSLKQKRTRKTCTVVLVEETLPFRHVARLHLDSLCGDKVLEIGCSTGELSKLVWRNHLEGGEERRSSWIGMDHSQEMIDRCSEQLDQHKTANPNACGAYAYASKVVKVDALEEPKRAAREATDVFGSSPTVVLIDIGGNRECGPVVKTMAWVFEAFGCSKNLRMVIVKSRALVRQLRSDSETIQTRNSINNNKSSNETIPSLDASTGIISMGTEWFATAHKRLLLSKKNRFEQRFKHPLKAPKAMSPVDGITPICRYHNYHKDGCKLYNDRETLGTVCPLDHDYCHSCLQKGHVAKNCPNRDTQSCY